MKRKIKLLSLLLSFSLTLTTISCQVEEDVVSSKNQSEIKVKKIKENRINNYSFALEKINTINNVKKENINSKIIIDPVLDILIDTEEAMLIEGDNFTSLTFPVYRENSNDFENLVVQQMDNTTKTYLVNYGPNKEAAMNGQNTNASIREIVFNTENLNNKIFYSSSNTVVYSDETGNLNYYCDETYEITNEYGYMDVANPSTGESTITLINSTCSYYWSFHYSTGGGAGGSSSNNHGGLGAGTGSTTVTTAPITTTMAAQIVKEFVKNLSPTQFAWWTNPVNDDAVASISSYLPQVDADPAFAMELIDLANDYLNSYGNTTENHNFISEIIIDILNPENDDVEPENVDIDPNCESFNFQQTGSNWQESAVLNIHFQVTVISPQGIYVNHLSEFPQAILFGCPINLSVGSTYISPGLAANTSAHALEQAMDETVKKFGNKPVSGMIVDMYFKQRLKHNYPLYIPGGRVNFNANNFTIIPTQYRTSFGNGNCN
ncbi:hypothetical protein GFJ94_09065 [Flavobacterium sp. LMO8]|uniref:hypothetical protein n=1 Tax=Flavobacterium sp. LMO8 TaxID=2654244 RepID=UPI0012923707|nr:hypothetical protein [Flavobacterium sp. LMO8]MQP25214.1 hypothetical protein [Flavobacterium sp. LMO8]